MKKKLFTKNKTKLFIGAGAILGVGISIVASTSLAYNQTEEVSKILFDGKIFSNYQEALKYFLARNSNAINKELKYGDINKSIVSLNTGELNERMLGDAIHSKKSVVYKTAFGRDARDFDEAQKTYVNSIFRDRQFTYAGTDKTYSKREDAQKALDSSLYTDKTFFYKFKNNLYDSKLKSEDLEQEKINKRFNFNEIVINPFNEEQINDLKKYLANKNVLSKMLNRVKEGFMTSANPDLNGFNIGIYARENAKEKFNEFIPGQLKESKNTLFKRIYDSTKVSHSSKSYDKEQGVSFKLTTNNDDKSSWNKEDLVMKFANKKTITVKDPGPSDESTKFSVGEDFELEQGKKSLKFTFKTEEGTTEKGVIVFDENLMPQLDIKEIKNISINEEFKDWKAKINEIVPNGTPKTKVEITFKRISGWWEHDQWEKLGWWKGLPSFIPDIKVMTGSHSFHIQKVKWKVSKTRVYNEKYSKNIVMKVENLKRLLSSVKKENVKQVVRYNDVPLFEIKTNKNGVKTLENISASPEYADASKFADDKNSSINNGVNFDNLVNFNQARLYTKNKIAKFTDKKKNLYKSFLYMGDPQNKSNDRNSNVQLGLYWGEKLFYDKEQFNSRVLSDQVNSIDSQIKGYWIQENSIAKNQNELNLQKKKGAPIVVSIFVMLSLKGEPIIETESITDNSKYDGSELLLKNAKNKLLPEIDKEHIYIYRNGIWELFSNEVHSIYSIDIYSKKYFDTFEHVKQYLLEFIKKNSKKIMLK